MAMTKRAWAPDEKIRIALESMTTNITLAELCRKYKLNPNTIYALEEKFMEDGKLALSGGLKNPANEKKPR